MKMKTLFLALLIASSFFANAQAIWGPNGIKVTLDYPLGVTTNKHTLFPTFDSVHVESADTINVTIKESDTWIEIDTLRNYDNVLRISANYTLHGGERLYIVASTVDNPRPLYLMQGNAITDTLQVDMLNSTRGYVYSGSIFRAINGTIPTTSAGNFWNVKGNAGTNSGSNFLGTTDNASLKIVTNNIKRAVIDSNGNIILNPLDAEVNAIPPSSFQSVYGNTYIAHGNLTADNFLCGQDSSIEFGYQDAGGNPIYAALFTPTFTGFVNKYYVLLNSPIIQLSADVTLIDDIVGSGSSKPSKILLGGESTFGGNTVVNQGEVSDIYLSTGQSSCVGNYVNGENNTVFKSGVGFMRGGDNFHLDSMYIDGAGVSWDMNNADGENNYAQWDTIINLNYTHGSMVDDISFRGFDSVSHNCIRGDDSHIKTGTLLGFSRVSYNRIDTGGVTIRNFSLQNSYINHNRFTQPNIGIDTVMLFNSSICNKTNPSYSNVIGFNYNFPDNTLSNTVAIGGNLRYIDGNEAAGKVTTSDASGNASWKDNIQELDSVSMYALTPGTARPTYFCTDCAANGNTGALAHYTGSLWRKFW